MNLTVYQNITIHLLKINAVSNSSVLQIGSAGAIRSHSESYNTGGFAEPAPEIIAPFVPLSSVRHE